MPGETVKGYMDERWSEWFGELEIAHTEADGGSTILNGELPDQAALYGLLVKTRDLGLVLLSMKRVEKQSDERPYDQEKGV